MVEREYAENDSVVVDFNRVPEIQHLNTSLQGDICGFTEQHGDERVLVDIGHTGVVYAVTENAIDVHSTRRPLP